ncbi:MAG: formylglycine-generating enzyme family protein, partial [Bradymonadaceae bacterium]
AKVVLFRYVDHLRRLVEEFVSDLGTTPIEKLSLPHGSYLLKITPADSTRVNLRVPVTVGRLKDTLIDIHLYEKADLPSDFVVILGGEFLSGSRDLILEESRLSLDDFAIKRHPVTCEEYLEFLNDVAETDFELALRHTPRVGDDAKSYFPLTDDNHFIIPQEDAEGDSWSPQWPVCMINLHAAEAYAAWRSDRDGRSYRLPTSEEWEKAARGVDGRLYPWGDVFDPIFCHMRESRPGRALPAPVGSYATDCSPYGVYDMAGNICEWTATSIAEDGHTHTLRGGSYASFPLLCRLDWYLNSPTTFRYPNYGFRLAMDLP